MPKYFLGEALATANMIRNRCPSMAIKGNIPYELWFQRALTREVINDMRVFGCRAWDLKLEGKGKLESRAVECVYFGQVEGVKEHKLYCLHEKKICISRNVKFEENIFPYQSKIPNLIPQPLTAIGNVTSESENSENNLGGDTEIPNDQLRESDQDIAVNLRSPTTLRWTGIVRVMKYLITE